MTLCARGALVDALVFANCNPLNRASLCASGALADALVLQVCSPFRFTAH